MRIEKCPICGRAGSVHSKWVLNKNHERYYYNYVAHYSAGRVFWHYVGSSMHDKESEDKAQEDIDAVQEWEQEAQAH